MLHAAISYICLSLLICLQLTDYQLLFFCKITFTAVAIRVKVHAGTLWNCHTINKCVNDYILYFLQVQSCSAEQWLKCAGVVTQCAPQCAQGASSQTCISCMGAPYNQCKGCPTVIKEIQQHGKSVSACMCMCEVDAWALKQWPNKIRLRCCANHPLCRPCFGQYQASACKWYGMHGVCMNKQRTTSHL